MIHLACCPAPRPLLQTRARGEMSFNIDGHHMYEFDRTLYNWAVTYPAETGEQVPAASWEVQRLLLGREWLQTKMTVVEQ